MQGVVDIRTAKGDRPLQVHGTAQESGLIQRTAIRRMYDTLPPLGIRFATPTATAYPTAIDADGRSGAARIAPRLPRHRRPPPETKVAARWGGRSLPVIGEVPQIMGAVKPQQDP